MKCFLCYQDEIVQFLDLGQQPLANKYPTKEEIHTEDFYPIKVYFCTRCKNVQLGTIVSRERMFVDYFYLSSVNQGLVRHFEEFAQSLAHAQFVVDIGSNDGILLKPLQALGVTALGVEPSKNVSKIANDRGLSTINAFFDAATVEQIRAHYGQADMVVASSVFTHLENPHQLVEDVKNLLTADGAFLIEVEYIGSILEHVQFERFYLDRIFYYSLTSLMHLFAAHGMYIADIKKIEPHGGSLRVVARRQGNGSVAPHVTQLLKEEEESLNLSVLEEFVYNIEAHLVTFRNKLAEYKASNLKVAGYGAPARVATICNYGKIGPSLIEFIVDDSPLKQHRLSPGTHIPIVPNTYMQEHKPDVLVVFAYEYFDDIKEKTKGAYRYLVPIPPREVS